MAEGQTTLAADSPNFMWPPHFGGAIFDFDGTISDTASLWEDIDRKFLAERNIPYSVEFPRTLSAMGFDQGAKYTVEHYHLNEDPKDIVNEWMRMSQNAYRTEAVLRPGVIPYLRALRSAHIPYALATTNTSDLLDSMQRIPIRELFPIRVFGADVAHTKDHPDIYLEAAHRLNVAPDRCIVFEDLAVALRAANQAGCITCAIASGDPLQHVTEVQEIADVFLSDWKAIPVPKR
ncbi:MAG: HAD family hydrolase [Coriobacteriaceae bacterium]